MEQKKDKMANWVKVQKDSEMVRIDSQIRGYNEKVFELEDQIRVLERKMDKLFFVRNKQKTNIQSFVDLQNRKKNKYIRLQEISANTVFIQKQSNKMINIIEGQQSQIVFNKLDYSLQAIDHEIKETEEEIHLLRQELTVYQNRIDSLYLSRRALNI